MCTSNNRKFHALKRELANKQLLVEDKYPKTVEGGLQVFIEYVPAGANRPFPTSQDTSGVVFMLAEQNKVANKASRTAKNTKAKKAPTTEGVNINSKGGSNCFMCKL